MLFCSNCGNQLNGEEKFCPKCGNPIPCEESTSTEQNAVIDMPNQPIRLTGKLNQEIAIEDDIITVYRHSFKPSEKQSLDDNYIKIPLSDVVGVIFYPSKGMGTTGFLSIVDKQGNGKYCNNQEALLGSNAVSFSKSQNEEFEKLFNDLIVNLHVEPIEVGGQAPGAFSAQGAPMTKRQRIAENKAAGIACCPKCGSTSLSGNKKGFGVGKAIVGAGLFGPMGLIAGNKGAKKVFVTCLNCGHRWKL